MNGRSHRLGVLAALCVFVALAIWVGSVPVEDVFVSHSYARNVAAGNGLAFNAGDAATEGYPSLLWVLICATLAAVGFDIPFVATYVSLFFGALCVLILWSLLRRRAEKTAYWLTTLLVFASSAPFVVASMIGSDASLFSVLLLASVWLMDRLDERPSVWNAAAFGSVVSLALLCRFEAVVMAVVAVVVLLRSGSASRRSSRYAWSAASFIALVAIVYHGWRVWTFGHVLPDSVVLRIGLNAGVFGSVSPYDIAPFGAYYLVVGIITVIAFRLAKSTPGERLGIAVALLLGIVYVFIQDPTPALSNHAALLALAVVTWPRVHLALMEQPAEPAQGPRRVVHVLLILSLLVIGGSHLADSRVTVGLMRESHHTALRPLGEWLASWRPNLVLATTRPGAINYYANSTTLDLRERSRLGSTESDRVRALVATSPDVVLLGARGGRHPLADPVTESFEQVFQRNYNTVAVVRMAWSHDRSITVNVRRDIPLLSEDEKSTFPGGLHELHLSE